MKTDNEKELDRWTAEALADMTSLWGPPLEKDLGVRPSDEDIWRIAQVANQYVLSHRVASNQKALIKTCERVDEIAETLRRTIVDSAKYCGNLAISWERGADDAVASLQREARKLARGRQPGTKLNAPLRPLTAAVLQAYHNAGKTSLGINTNPDTNQRYGPVLNAVKTSLRLAGVSELDLPKDGTIKLAAGEVRPNNR